MTYVKTYLPTLKTHVVNLKRDAKDSSRDLQRLEVRGKLGSNLKLSDIRIGLSVRKTMPNMKLLYIIGEMTTLGYPFYFSFGNPFLPRFSYLARPRVKFVGSRMKLIAIQIFSLMYTIIINKTC